MKKVLPMALLIAGAGLMRASIIETISLDLSTLHTGSTLAGTFSLSNTPAIGDTATALLSFSDPSDYSVSSLSATISIGSGTTGDTVKFSELIFTNPSGTSFTKNIDLTVAGAAQCASFPCTASGRFEDGNPASFTGTYSISPSAVPEPSFTLLVPVLLIGFAIKKRLANPCTGAQ